MAQSDITIDALSKVGQQDAEYLVSLVRSIPVSYTHLRAHET